MWNLSLSVRNVLSTKTLNHTGMFGKVYAAQKDARKKTWSYCSETKDIEGSLECFTDPVGNTFPVEIKFGDKSVRRGLLHLSITRLYKKCPPLLFKREIQRSEIWAKLLHLATQLNPRKLHKASLTRLPFEVQIVIVYAGGLVAGTATLHWLDIRLQSSLRIWPSNLHTPHILPHFPPLPSHILGY